MRIGTTNYVGRNLHEIWHEEDHAFLWKNLELGRIHLMLTEIRDILKEKENKE